MSKGAIVKASTEKLVPAYNAKIELEPNYYCRGRNVKRRKYCKSRAGLGTDHKGLGRCKFHGGPNQNVRAMKHGRYAKIVTPAIAKLIEHHEQDGTSVKDKMLANLNHTLALRDRALAAYAEEPTAEQLGAVIAFNDIISKSGYRLEQIRAHGTIPIDRVKLFMMGIFSILEADVDDPDLRARIRKSIGALRV